MPGKTIGRLLGKAVQDRRTASFEEQLAEAELTADERAALEPYVEVAVRKGSNPSLGLGLVAVLSVFIAGAGLFLLGMNVVLGLVLILAGPGLFYYFYTNDYQDMLLANDLKERLATEPASLFDEETAREYHHLLDTVDEAPPAQATPLPGRRLESEGGD